MNNYVLDISLVHLFSQGALFGCLAAIIFNLWMAIGGQMYGSPPVPLPPAPTYACADNTSAVVNVTGSSYDMTTISVVTTGMVSDHTNTRCAVLIFYQIQR